MSGRVGDGGVDRGVCVSDRGVCLDVWVMEVYIEGWVCLCVCVCV